MSYHKSDFKKKLKGSLSERNSNYHHFYFPLRLNVKNHKKNYSSTHKVQDTSQHIASIIAAGHAIINATVERLSDFEREN